MDNYHNMELEELLEGHDAYLNPNPPGLASSLATVLRHRTNTGDETAADLIRTYCRTRMGITDPHALNAVRPMINDWQTLAYARNLARAVRWLRNFGLGVFARGLDESPPQTPLLLEDGDGLPNDGRRGELPGWRQQQLGEAPDHPALAHGQPRVELVEDYTGFHVPFQEQATPVPYLMPATHRLPAGVPYARPFLDAHDQSGSDDQPYHRTPSRESPLKDEDHATRNLCYEELMYQTYGANW